MKPCSHLIIAIIAAFSPFAALSAMASENPGNPETDSEITYVPGHEGWRMYEPFNLTLSVGANINTGGKKNCQWFGTRPAVAPQMNYRLTGFLTRHWGIYGDLGLSIYKTEDDLKSGLEEIFTGIADALFLGMSRWHLSFGLGGAYRYETGRFQLTPRAGLNLLLTSKEKRTLSNDEGKWKSERHSAWLCAETGVEFGFRMSRSCSLVLDVDYSLPLQDSKFTLTPQNNSSTEKATFKSRAWGNELTVSLGIKIGFGNKTESNNAQQ